MLGCYRKIDAEDVSVFTRGVVATLAAYPAFAARSACDPIRGLPSRLKWPPTLAEIRAACEAELDPYRREAAARARLAPRRRRPEATPEERARVLQGLRDLSARLGATSRSRAFG